MKAYIFQTDPDIIHKLKLADYLRVFSDKL